MNEIQKYTIPTGDPFADIGGYAIEEISKREKQKNILELIEYVTDIYVEKWDAKINPFFLNSKITQPAFNKERKKEETRKYFQSLLDNSAEHTFGFCRMTGEETNLFPAGRDNSILSGSGTFVNFHHFFETGIMISKEAIIRFHFIPIACELLQGKIALIHSSNPDLTKLFVQNKIKRNLADVGRNISEGILKSEYKSPGTALFRFIDQIIQEKEEIVRDKTSSLTLYQFTNFGATPEIKIYNLPDSLFRFYQMTQRIKYREDWNKFTAQYYYNSEYKGAKWNNTSGNIEWNSKKESLNFTEKDYQSWNNRIYNKLLNDQSILFEIRKWSSKEKFDFEIVEIYQIGLRNMKSETINKINQMTDLIFKMNDDDGIRKAVKTLSGARSNYDLRRFIIKDVVSKNYKQNPDGEPALTVEEYANYLFSDSNSSLETRDVLLIAIYQKLHERNMKIDDLIIDEIEEDESDE